MIRPSIRPSTTTSSSPGGTEGDGAGEVGATALVGHVGELREQQRVVALVGQPSAWRPDQRADSTPGIPLSASTQSPRVVGDRRQPGRGQSGAGLEQRVALEGGLVLDRLVVRRHVVEAEHLDRRAVCSRPGSARISSSFLGLREARKTRVTTRTRERLLLEPGQVGAALLGQRQQGVELGPVERRALGGALHLDEPARRRSSRRSCRSRRGRPRRSAGRAAARRR